MEANRKAKFDPRKLMERSIEVMRRSVEEPREDSKASPVVGAVLWKPDGTVDTAARGEMRYGDHAEFGVLERKNRSTPLDGSFLFTTLEPCAPGACRHPKLGCAERIFNARVSHRDSICVRGLELESRQESRQSVGIADAQGRAAGRNAPEIPQVSQSGVGMRSANASRESGQKEDKGDMKELAGTNWTQSGQTGRDGLMNDSGQRRHKAAKPVRLEE